MKRQTGLRWATAAAVLALAAAGPATAQTQMNSKWITIVTSAEPPNLDGCMSTNTFQSLVIKHNVVETLIDKSADGTLKPRLATSWERVDDSNWRFKLRQGVTFHDGSPFNAQSLKKSLDRTMSRDIVCGDRTKFFNDLLIEVTPINEYEINIKTQRPESILAMRLATTAITGPNTPMDKLTAAGVGVVGTGPYVFDSWQTGQQILLKRNEKYWGAKPPVEGVRYLVRSESSVRAAMVDVGEADMAHAIAEQDANKPTDFSYLNSETTFLRIDTTQPPLDDKRVRLALNYAVDKKGLIGTVMPKAALLATQIVVPSIPGHNHELDKNPRPYDPAKAKQLLAEAKAAGVASDAEITLINYPTNFPNAGELMESIFTMYKAAGFNMKMISVEPGQYAKWNIKPFPDPRPPTLLLTAHDNNNGDPIFSMTSRFFCDGRSSTMCVPELEKEINRVIGLEGPARVAGWAGIFKTVYEDIVPDVMLHHMVAFTRVSPRIVYVPDIATNAEIRVEDIRFK